VCGICGVVHVDADSPVDKGMLGRMTDIIRHRGPDSDGFHLAPGIGLGVRRLSIIDLETGDQPISNEDQTVTVVCNGEIYNFKELRQELLARGHRFRSRSDVEVIVHLYEDYGVECLQHLRGMFSFALWDARRRRLMLARDRFGIKPLHYADAKEGLYFASEQKSILIADRIERKIDIRSLQDLFTIGFVASPKTLFTNIRWLLPGHYLLYEGGHYTIHSYWQPDFPLNADGGPRMSVDDWVEALREQLEESVRIHMRSDVPVGAWMSPGIDSSGVVSLMSRYTSQPIQTFTLAFENPEFDETATQKTLERYPGYALSNRQVICKRKHFDLFPKGLWHCEHPSPSGVGIPQLILAEATSGSVKVVLTGEGADEVFGGYPWYTGSSILEPLSKLPLNLRRLMARLPFVRKKWPGASRILSASNEMNLKRFSLYMSAQRSTKYQNQLFSSSIVQSVAEIGWPWDRENPPAHINHSHPFVQLQYYDMHFRLPDYIIHHLDRKSMAHSLEARVPYLDHKLVEFCARIPHSLKVRRFQEKHILRLAMQAYLPPEIVRRRKRGLRAPLRQWLREDLPDFAEDLLSEERLRQRGYFNPAFVTHILKQHRAGNGNYRWLLVGVLGVQLWDDMFLHGCRPSGNQNSPA
jgi:asparagine synthase (glutamine-hydrolysing)